jgi:hypothetical protein
MPNISYSQACFHEVRTLITSILGIHPSSQNTSTQNHFEESHELLYEHLILQPFSVPKTASIKFKYCLLVHCTAINSSYRICLSLSKAAAVHRCRILSSMLSLAHPHA